MGTLTPFLEWWVGPLPDGVMDAVFPTVVEILMREDDTQTLIVISTIRTSLILDGTALSAGSNFNPRRI